MLLHGITQNRVGEVFWSVAGELTRGSKTQGAGGTPVTCCRLANAAWSGWGTQVSPAFSDQDFLKNPRPNLSRPNYLFEGVPRSDKITYLESLNIFHHSVSVISTVPKKCWNYLGHTQHKVI